LGDFSFSKADRIRKRPEYLYLARIGRKFQNRHFILIYAPGRDIRPRLGITVSKRVGDAVARNQIKRWVREYFRTHRQQLRGVWDINIIAKDEAAALSANQAYSSLETLFKKINDHRNR
jgi:ribonuclease P protein component